MVQVKNYCVPDGCLLSLWVGRRDFQDWLKVRPSSPYLTCFIHIAISCRSAIILVTKNTSLDTSVRGRNIFTSTINQQMYLYNFPLKHFKTHKTTRHVSIFSDHHQGVSSFLAKVITYSRFSSFL